MILNLESVFNTDTTNSIQNILEQTCKNNQRISFGDLAAELGYPPNDKINSRKVMSLLGCMLKLNVFPRYDVCPAGGIGLIGSPSLSQSRIQNSLSDEFVSKLQEFLNTNCIEGKSYSRTVVAESFHLNNVFLEISLEKLESLISQAFTNKKIVGFNLLRGSGITISK